MTERRAAVGVATAASLLAIRVLARRKPGTAGSQALVAAQQSAVAGCDDATDRDNGVAVRTCAIHG